MQTYGANAWRIHNYRLESAATILEKAVEEMKELTVEVNRQRKNSQVRIISICILNVSLGDILGAVRKTIDDAGDTVDGTDLKYTTD